MIGLLKRLYRPFRSDRADRLMAGLFSRAMGVPSQAELSGMITKAFEIWPSAHVEELIRHVNDVGQKRIDGYTSLPVDETQTEADHPFPAELRAFESLYDKNSGNWQVPFPTVKIEKAGKKLFPRLMADSIELETGHFYYAFVRLIDASTILETGVSRGYSTACIASALKTLNKDGHVYAVDPAEYPHLWEGTGLENYITWLPKMSQETLPDFEGLEFDLLVIDSHHDYDTCHWEVSNFEKLLKPGGYMLMHDSLHYDGVGAVVYQLQQNPRFEMVTLPTPRGKLDPMPRRSGLTIARKIRSGSPQVEYDSQYRGWFWGDLNQPPFLWRIEDTKRGLEGS